MLPGYLVLAVATVFGCFRQEAESPDPTVAADIALLKTVGVADDPALLTLLRQRCPTDADRRQLEGFVRQLGSDSFEERERATQDLIARGSASQPALKRAVRDPDLEIVRRAEHCLHEIDRVDPLLRAAVLREVLRRRPEGAVAVLLLYASFADESEQDDVLSNLTTLSALRWSEAGPELLRALRDPSPARRQAAGYALGRSPEKSQREAVHGLLTDSEPKVRLRAAQGLIAGQDKNAVPALIDLLAAPDDIGWEADDLLRRIAGDHSPALDASGGKAEAQRKQRDAWTLWWRDHANDVDLARVSERPPHLGLTLVAQVDNNRIFEFDRSGKVRWTLTVSGGPIEAHMLPGNRLLIAENVDNRIVERDLKGKVVWEVKVPDRTLSCQRLANGNTFVVTNSTVGEYTRNGQVVYSHDLARLKGGRINSGVKLRNGTIAVITDKGPLDLVDATTGAVLRSIALPVRADCYGLAEALGGRFLVSSYGSGVVVELDGAGKEVWRYEMPSVFHATRLPNGNTLMSVTGRAVFGK